MTAARLQQEIAASYTTEGILASLGYPDPLVAARQHARMILLGRQARYQAAMRQLEAKWGCTLGGLRARYLAHGSEDFAADDDYVQWQWYADAVRTIEAQLTALIRS
jgi:hypothetical protein